MKHETNIEKHLKKLKFLKHEKRLVIKYMIKLKINNNKKFHDNIIWRNKDMSILVFCRCGGLSSCYHYWFDMNFPLSAISDHGPLFVIIYEVDSQTLTE